MLGKADVLSIHIPLTKENENFVDDKIIRALKKGAVIVNTARGGVMDDEALISALSDGHVSYFQLPTWNETPSVTHRFSPWIMCSSMALGWTSSLTSHVSTPVYWSCQMSPYYLTSVQGRVTR